jgi:tetratricopeptide (TPR) repeat protein
LLRQGHSFSGFEPNCVYLNCRGARFANASSVTGLDFVDDGRALGVTDWDQDGDLDVWLGNRTGPRLRLMRNSTIDGATNHTEHGYVAFRLQGTKSNRDAIGARVTVHLVQRAGSSPTPAAQPLIQTLRAGDAFLSQSSKWVHFGLGSGTEVKKVEVRWPSGTVESFPDIRAGERYQLVEGSGRTELLPLATREIALAPRRQESVPLSSVSRTYLSNRVPMPLISYEPFESNAVDHGSRGDDIAGGQATPINVAGRPLLVTLWASWCQPCLLELHDMAANAETLREAGVDVLAVSIDGLDSSQSTTAADARAALERLKSKIGRGGFPFASGMATREMLDKLSVVESIVFNFQAGLVVPTSYLFDSDGHLAVAYKGPVKLDQLEQDVAQLNLPLAERRKLSAALPGRWISRPRLLLMRAVAGAFRDRGYDEDYARYMKLDADMLDRQLAGARTDKEQQELTEQFAAANFNLGMTLVSSGDFTEAASYFERTIELKPDHVEALINLGAVYGRARNVDMAVKSLQRAVELSPDSIPARVNLASALSASGEFAAAIPHYEAILSAEPNSANGHAHLARALIELSRIEPAVEHLETAVRLNPRDFAATVTLAWLRATSPIDAIRDGGQALEIAQRLNAASGNENPMLLDVLAAALAEQGNFDSALATMRNAVSVVGDRNSSVRQIFLARIKLYEAHQPLRDSDGRYP